MSVQIPSRPLRDLLSFIVDNRGKTCPVSETGLPLIATNCVTNSTLYPQFEKVRYVNQDTYENWFRAHPEPGDLIFVLKGTPGRTCLTPDPVNFCIAQDMVALRADQDIVDPSYLFAALRSPQIQHDIGNLHVGSMIAHFKKGDFDRLQIPLPDRDTQEAIGAVYMSLSHKIEANRKAAACLEEMARALYRSWFVTFDPVHAKSQNRPPAHMAPTTAALFPDRFGENGLPVGWVAGTVGDLLTLQRGFDLPKKERTDGAFPVLAAGGHHGTHKEFKVRGPGVTTGRSGVIGEVFLVLDDFWPLNTSLWVKDFIRCSPYFAYFLLQTLDLKALNSGSAVPSLNRNNVHNLSVDLPPERIIAAFDELAGPMFERVRHITIENQTLATLRDTLLPRLMSGTLRVKAAKAEVEAVL